MTEPEALIHARGLENAVRLAASTALDLEQFVTRVRDAVERLAVVSSNPEVSAEVESLRVACVRAAELTSQLSALGRREAPDPQHVDLTRAVSNMAPLLRRMAGPGTRVYLDCSTDPAPVRVDPAKLRSLLFHLVSQARDAMAGDGRVVVGTRVSPGGPVLWVGDEGPPFELPAPESPADLLRSRRAGKRTGLDLAAASAVAQRAGGDLSLASSPAGGGQVEIRFPPG